MLDAKGAPGVAQQVLIQPPSSWLGPLSDAERRDVIARSPIAGRYESAVDRHSAYEALIASATATATARGGAATPSPKYSQGRRDAPTGRHKAPPREPSETGRWHNRRLCQISDPRHRLTAWATVGARHSWQPVQGALRCQLRSLMLDAISCKIDHRTKDTMPMAIDKVHRRGCSATSARVGRIWIAR